MQKVYFKKRYGLQQAVKEGTKTNTRRLLKVPAEEVNAVNCALADIENLEANKKAILDRYAQYQVGEVVAVAESYKDVFEEADKGNYWDDRYELFRQATVDDKPGWDNKLFVRAELMPDRIIIKGRRLELLQDISDEDCIKEGVIRGRFKDFPNDMYFPYRGCKDSEVCYTPRYAFHLLIDRICGRGTWDLNRWFIAYDFLLERLSVNNSQT